MPHTCTLLRFLYSASFFSNRIPLFFWVREPLNILVVIPRRKNHRLQGDGTRFKQKKFSSPPTDGPDGPERGDLWLRDKETLVNNKICLANAHSCKHTHTHTAEQSIVHLSSFVIARRWRNVKVSGSRTLETWCHLGKNVFSKRNILHAQGHTVKREEGDGRAKDIKPEKTEKC